MGECLIVLLSKITLSRDEGIDTGRTKIVGTEGGGASPTVEEKGNKRLQE